MDNIKILLHVIYILLIIIFLLLFARHIQFKTQELIELKNNNIEMQNEVSKIKAYVRDLERNGIKIY